MSVALTYLLACITFVTSSKTNEFKLQNVTAGDGIFLESPEWSMLENALYWVDDFAPKVFRMDGTTGEISSREVGHGLTTMVKHVKDYPGHILVAVNTSLYLLEWGAPGGDAAFKLLTTVDHDRPDNNIADGCVDAAGRLLFGTFGPLALDTPSIVIANQARLYSIHATNYARPQIMKQPVTLSTGLTWSLDNKKMYYNDSPTKKVVVFDYDIEKGTIANERVLFDFVEHGIAGVPDGMTRDVDGNLWIATYYGRSIIQINPHRGSLLRHIELPVDQVSNLIWGGSELDILYVTTGRIGLNDTMPLSGALLELTGLGTKGVPENGFAFPDAPMYSYNPVAV